MGPLKVTFKRQSMEAETEFGSLAELAGAIQDQGAALIQMFGADMETIVLNLGGSTAAPAETEAQGEQTDKKERKPRGPNKPRQEVAPPAAPAPIPVGPDMTPNANGIPAALDRTNPAAVVHAPPAPPKPPAPPTPPVPPAGVLAAKIIPFMEGIATGTPGADQQWLDWLASPGVELVVQGATFAEAMKCLRMLSDDKLKPVADALGIAA